MKMANGSGSVIKLSGNRRKPYTVRITVGWQDGKQVRKYLGYYRTHQEAVSALAEYYKTGYDIDSSKLTLGEVYERWIKRIEPKVSHNVLVSHNMAYSRFDRLGNMPIGQVKADHLQDWMDTINLKTSSKKRIKSTMIQLYKYAIKNDIVGTNYAEHIEVDGEEEKTGNVFTKNDIRVLWDNVENPTARWVLILMYTGLRIGELLALTGDTIYLDEQYMIGGLKSDAGRNRVIPLHQAIIPLVEEQLGRGNRLMRSKTGHKMSYVSALRDFKQLMVDLNLGDHKPHDTRKTAVSMMHGAGIPIETIRIIVGHSGKGVTEAVYLHKTPEELVEAINMVKVL